nr:uncharacterized protein LOC117684670 [Crassostrea gigas]
MAENEENENYSKSFHNCDVTSLGPCCGGRITGSSPIQAVKDSKEVAEKTDSDAMGVSGTQETPWSELLTNPFKVWSELERHCGARTINELMCSRGAPVTSRSTK